MMTPRVLVEVRKKRIRALMNRLALGNLERIAADQVQLSVDLVYNQTRQGNTRRELADLVEAAFWRGAHTAAHAAATGGLER